MGRLDDLAKAIMDAEDAAKEADRVATKTRIAATEAHNKLTTLKEDMTRAVAKHLDHAVLHSLGVGR